MTVPGLGTDVGGGNSHNYCRGIIRQGVSVYGACWCGHCSYGSEVSLSPLLHLLILLTPWLEQFTVGRKGLVGELGLVLEPDLISDLIVLHCLLQDPAVKHLLGLGEGKLALGDEGADAGRQGMDTLIRELADIREKLIPEMPEMLLGFDNNANSIKSILGHLLVLQSDGLLVDKGLESLSIFTLKHHLQLLPACVQVISLISIDVKGFKVVKHTGIEDFSVLQLMGELKLNLGASQQLLGWEAIDKWRSTGELPNWLRNKGEWLGTRGNC